MIIDAGPTSIGIESTVISCVEDKPILLRSGGIPTSELEGALDKELTTKTPLTISLLFHQVCYLLIMLQIHQLG